MSSQGVTRSPVVFLPAFPLLVAGISGAHDPAAGFRVEIVGLLQRILSNTGRCDVVGISSRDYRYRPPAFSAVGGVGAAAVPPQPLWQGGYLSQVGYEEGTTGSNRSGTDYADSAEVLSLPLSIGLWLVRAAGSEPNDMWETTVGDGAALRSFNSVERNSGEEGTGPKALVVMGPNDIVAEQSISDALAAEGQVAASFEVRDRRYQAVVL